jgi:dephospho-CoA kinase
MELLKSYHGANMLRMSEVNEVDHQSMQHMLTAGMVDAPHDVCVARVMERSNTTAAEVERRMAEQLSMEEKRGLADFVIENGSTLADLERATTMVATIIEVFPDPEH